MTAKKKTPIVYFVVSESDAVECSEGELRSMLETHKDSIKEGDEVTVYQFHSRYIKATTLVES